MALIMGGLVLWGAYVAIGAYLYNLNPWRAVIVMASRGRVSGLLAAVAVDAQPPPADEALIRGRASASAAHASGSRLDVRWR